jgi:4-hydroxybenzoate polyprenyltransferase
MYPLHVNVPYSFMLFFGYYLLLQAVHGFASLKLTRESLLGALTLACFTLLLRVFDEFKDYEHDRELFPDRPLPSGRVTKADLTSLGWALVALMTAFNAYLGGKALLGYAILMAFGFLMLKFFFLPDLHRKSLLLTLATHNPVALFTHLYVLGVFAAAHPGALRPGSPGVWLGIAMFWGLIFAWETGRKIRAPEEETDYVTYSRIFGAKRAPLLPAAALTVSFGLGVWFAWTLHLSPLLPVVLVLAWTYAMTALSRFVSAPSPGTSRLRPRIETASLVLYAAFLVALPVKFGLW